EEQPPGWAARARIRDAKPDSCRDLSMLSPGVGDQRNDRQPSRNEFGWGGLDAGQSVPAMRNDPPTGRALRNETQNRKQVRDEKGAPWQETHAKQCGRESRQHPLCHCETRRGETCLRCFG